MHEEIGQGRFREDLYYRLSVFSLHLPPLRQRMDDLPTLVEHFVKHFGRQLKKPVASVPAEAMQLLKRYDWPGNVRELQSAMKYAIVQMTSDVLLPTCLPEGIRGASPTLSSSTEKRPGGPLDVAGMVAHLADSGHEDIYREMHNVVDRIIFDEILCRVEGNQVAASRLLGISRTTLRNKLASLGLDGDDYQPRRSDTAQEED